MQSEVEAAHFGGGIDLDRRYPVDEPQHRVGESERPHRGDGDSGDLLDQERRVSREETVGPMRVEKGRRKYAEQNDAECSAYAVYAPDIQRVIPLEPVF